MNKLINDLLTLPNLPDLKSHLIFIIKLCFRNKSRKKWKWAQAQVGDRFVDNSNLELNKRKDSYLFIFLSIPILLSYNCLIVKDDPPRVKKLEACKLVLSSKLECGLFINARPNLAEKYEDLGKEKFLNFLENELYFILDTKAWDCRQGICKSGDCENGQGEITFSAGSSIKGIFENKKLNGSFEISQCDGVKIVGNAVNDSITKAEVRRTDGSYYIGQLNARGEFEGKGIYVDPKESKIYEGIWKENKKNGAFNVYFDYNPKPPLLVNNVVNKDSYSKKLSISYVLDEDKIDFDKKESDRKRLQKERETELNELMTYLKTERQKYVKEEVERKKQEEKEKQLREKERIEQEKRDQEYDKKRMKEKEEENICKESRYKYSDECNKFEKKYGFNPLKENN
jgi:hypothetical protein